VQRSGDQIGWATLKRTEPNVTTYTDKLGNTGNRWYRVQAFNALGNSDFSNVFGPISAPLCGSQVSVNVSWGPTAGHTYRLYYGTASGQYGPKIEAGPGPSYQLNGLNPMTDYYFALSAVANGAESLKGAEVPYTTTAQTQQTLTLP
jgi:hypothetical protein